MKCEGEDAPWNYKAWTGFWERKIISTVIVFGGVQISEEIKSKRRLEDAEKILSSNPKSKSSKINFEKLKICIPSHIIILQQGNYLN